MIRRGRAPPTGDIYQRSVTGWDAATGEIELGQQFQGVPSYSGPVLAEMNANPAARSTRRSAWSTAKRSAGPLPIARARAARRRRPRISRSRASGTLIQPSLRRRRRSTTSGTSIPGARPIPGLGNAARPVHHIRRGLLRQFPRRHPHQPQSLHRIQRASASGVESCPRRTCPRSSSTARCLPRAPSTSVSPAALPRWAPTIRPPAAARIHRHYPRRHLSERRRPVGHPDRTTTPRPKAARRSRSRWARAPAIRCRAPSLRRPPARTASTYTITDNDLPVVLAKTWDNGIAGDAVGWRFRAGPERRRPSTVGGIDDQRDAVAIPGQHATLTEAYTAGVATNYNSSTRMPAQRQRQCRRRDRGTGLSRTVVTCPWARR